MSQNEKKIRQVYEALELKNYKSAIKKSTTFLQAAKDPKEILVFRVLKALVLERMGKGDEALEECTIAEKEVPTDEWVLSTLYQIFRNLKKLERATACYENAFKKEPNNETLLQSIFFSYTREFKYKEQQDTAMKLIKNFAKPKYYYYATATMIQQVPLDNNNHILLTLAHRMVDKIVADGNIKTTEELLFCLDLLERIQEYPKALEFLSRPSFSSLFKNKTDLLEEKAKFFKYLSKNEELTSVSKELLFQNPENWDYYIQYFNSLFPVDSSEVSFDKLKEIEITLEELKEKVDPKDRNYALSKIELKYRVYSLSKDDKDKQLEDLLSAIKEYIKIFGDKFCTARDLYYYLKSLPHDSTLSLISEYKKSLTVPFGNDFTDVSEDEQVRVLYRYIVIEKIYTKLGFYSSESDEEKLARHDQYYSIYLRSLEHPISAKLEDSDRQIGDDLVSLAASIFIDLYLKHGENKYVVLAIELLEFGLNRSKHNFHFKVLIIRLYCLLGAITPAFEIYKSLSIKYLQNDTTSFYLLDDIIKINNYAERKSIFESVSKFYNDAEKELPELITFPYRHGSYSKVKEFLAFKDKLMKTQQRTILNVEYAFYQLLNIHSPLDFAQLTSSLSKNLSNASVNGERLDQLVDTTDNSGWDDVHEIGDLCSSSFNSCADIKRPQEKKQLILFRSLLFQFLHYFLEGNAEAVIEITKNIVDLSSKLFPAEGDNLNSSIWLSSVNLIRFSYKILFLINEFQDKQSPLSSADNGELINLLDQFQAESKGLWEKVKTLFSNFEGKNLPYISSFLINFVIFSHIQVQYLNKQFPNRIKKSAKAELKDLHKNVKPKVKSLATYFSTLLTEFAAESSKAKNELTKVELFNISKVDHQTADYARERMKQSYVTTFHEFSSLSTTFATLK